MYLQSKQDVQLVLNKNRNRCKVKITEITEQVPEVHGQVLLLVESYFVHFHNVPTTFFYDMVDKAVRKEKKKKSDRLRDGRWQ